MESVIGLLRSLYRSGYHLFVCLENRDRPPLTSMSEGVFFQEQGNTLVPGKKFIGNILKIYKIVFVFIIIEIESEFFNGKER